MQTRWNDGNETGNEYQWVSFDIVFQARPQRALASVQTIFAFNPMNTGLFISL